MPSSFSKYLSISLFFTLIALGSGTCLAEKVVAVETIPLDTIQPPPPPEMLFGGFREVMPLFPGCDEIAADYPSRKKCADSLMLTFIYANLRYPYVAWRDSVEGTAVVSFTVEKDGSITGIEVVRDPGAGTAAEALRLVNLMATKEKRWTPGVQAGKLVRVRFNLPVRFKLTEGTVPYLNGVKKKIK